MERYCSHVVSSSLPLEGVVLPPLFPLFPELSVEPLLPELLVLSDVSGFLFSSRPSLSGLPVSE